MGHEASDRAWTEIARGIVSGRLRDGDREGLALRTTPRFPAEAVRRLREINDAMAAAVGHSLPGILERIERASAARA
jgi:hypothetical protein